MSSASRPDAPMEILSSYLQQIRRLAAMENLSQPLQDLIEKASKLAAGHDPYLEEITTPESDALMEIAHTTNTTDWDQLHQQGLMLYKLPKECLTGHVEGQFMKTLVRVSGAMEVLEVGMFTGYCSLAMAEALPDTGRVVTLDLEPHLLSLAQPIFNKSPHGKKIHVIIGPAQNSLMTLAADNRQFDLIFIDADKVGYLNYYKTIMDMNLLSPRGALVIDNALYKGDVYVESSQRSQSGQAIAEFNEYVKSDTRTEQVLIPLRDGVLIITRKHR